MGSYKPYFYDFLGVIYLNDEPIFIPHYLESRPISFNNFSSGKVCKKIAALSPLPSPLQFSKLTDFFLSPRVCGKSPAASLRK